MQKHILYNVSSNSVVIFWKLCPTLLAKVVWGVESGWSQSVAVYYITVLFLCKLEPSIYRFVSGPPPLGLLLPVEPKTRTYHGRVGAGLRARRSGGDGRAGQNGTPTDRFAQERTVPLTLWRIKDKRCGRLLGSTNKGNPM